MSTALLEVGQSQLVGHTASSSKCFHQAGLLLPVGPAKQLVKPTHNAVLHHTCARLGLALTSQGLQHALLTYDDKTHVQPQDATLYKSLCRHDYAEHCMHVRCSVFVQCMCRAQMRMVYLINAMQAGLIGLPIENEQAARHQQH